MGKYLLVLLVFMLVGIPISFISPTTGDLRAQPLLTLFYASIGGACIIIVYGSYAGRRERQKENAKRRSRK